MGTEGVQLQQKKNQTIINSMEFEIHIDLTTTLKIAFEKKNLPEIWCHLTN